MALVKQLLKTELQALFTELAQQTDNQDGAIEKFADRLSSAIDTYIKTATVTVDVTTVGSATTQKGIGTGKLT